MYILRIEHPVKSFEDWKKLFDSDPANRQKSGVRQYRILRSADDTNYVMIDLEFDTAGQAEALLANLRNFWGQVQGKVIFEPKVRIAEIVESKKY
jgi:hypothetical protein